MQLDVIYAGPEPERDDADPSIFSVCRFGSQSPLSITQEYDQWKRTGSIRKKLFRSYSNTRTYISSTARTKTSYILLKTFEIVGQRCFYRGRASKWNKRTEINAWRKKVINKLNGCCLGIDNFLSTHRAGCINDKGYIQRHLNRIAGDLNGNILLTGKLPVKSRKANDVSSHLKEGNIRGQLCWVLNTYLLWTGNPIPGIA